MATVSPEQIRSTLADIGERRLAKRTSDQELADETERAVVQARDAGVPISEAARLLHVHRTTLYRVYGA